MVALASLVALLPIEQAVFGACVRHWGRPRGINAAFAIYWVTCCGCALGLLGRARTVALFAPRSLAWWEIGLLVGPVLGAFAYAFLPRLHASSGRVIAFSLGRGALNAISEELFWRGLFVALFPSSLWLGWLLPAALFGAWHLIPLRANGPHRSHLPLLAGAVAIGFAYGWVAWQTGTILWTTAAHILVDACGLDAARFALGPAGASHAEHTLRRPR